MSYIIWPDLKSVATFNVAKGGITIEGHGFMPDSEVDKLNHRLFATHPDVNPLCSRDEEGYVLYKGQRLEELTTTIYDRRGNFVAIVEHN